MDTFAVNVRVRGTEIVQIIFQTSQYQLLKSQSLKLNKERKTQKDKLKT